MNIKTHNKSRWTIYLDQLISNAKERIHFSYLFIEGVQISIRFD